MYAIDWNAGEIYWALQENQLITNLDVFSLGLSYLFRLGLWASLVAQRLMRLPAMWRPRFDLSVGKIPWRRKRQPTPVFLPGESQGGRSLVGYSPWGHKESDMTERLHFTSGLDWVRRHSVIRHVSLTQLCPTLCNSINDSSSGPPVHGILQAKILGVICHVFLQGIFLTRDWNWVLLHHRQILYLLRLQKDLPST